MTLPLLSALLLILAQPPFSLLPLPFLALVPLTLGLEALPRHDGAGREAALLGLWFGLGFWGVSLFWVLTQVAPTFSWALPGFGVLLLLLGGLSALFSWCYLKLRRLGGLPLFLALPLAWVAVEWIKAHAPFGLAFPWLGLSVGLTETPTLLGLAEWGGEPGVAFWVAMVNGLAATAILHGRGGSSRWRWWGLALAVALIPAGLGSLRARTLELHPGPTVLAVGTDVPRALRGDPEAYGREALAQVRAALAPWLGPPGFSVDSTGDGRGRRPELVLLPEATVPMPFGRPEARPFRQALASLAGEVGAPILLGAQDSLPGDGGGEGGVANAILLLSPGGQVLDRYHKARLVPAMESGYLRGEGGEAMHGGPVPLGPLLCYESLFGSLARDASRNGARVLVNLSSDVWFGRGVSGLSALFLHQHPAHLVLRAAETRLPAVRSANGGFTLVLDPLGRRVGEELVPGQRGAVMETLAVADGTTLFTRTGDLAGPGSLFLALLLLAWRYIRRGRGGWGGGTGEAPEGPA